MGLGDIWYQHLYTIKYHTYIGYTLIMNTSGKRAQHIYQLSQFTCNIPVCIQLAIAYKIYIKKHQSIVPVSSIHPHITPPPPPQHPHILASCTSTHTVPCTKESLIWAHRCDIGGKMRARQWDFGAVRINKYSAQNSWRVSAILSSQKQWSKRPHDWVWTKPSK